MKTIQPANAANLIPDGVTLLIGGLMGVGTPSRLVDALVKLGSRNLTIIANDTTRHVQGSALAS